MTTITGFQQRVYKLLQKVPKGKVTTYAILAKALNCGSSQAVGGALKRNPFAPEVPCHRVVKSDRSLGGFYGQIEGPQIENKKALLLAEGVKFDADNKVMANCLWQFK